MKIGCVIMAGGKSSRMGTDKALLEINGKKFIEQLVEEFDGFEEKLIARGNNSRIDNASWKLVKDIYQERGPIGGLHAALTECESDALFCISCDMPLMKRTLAAYLCSSLTKEYDAVIAKTEDGRIHPMCAVYRKKIATILEEQILSGNNRIMSAFERLQVKYVSIDLEKDAQQLLNVNTPQDYSELKNK